MKALSLAAVAALLSVSASAFAQSQPPTMPATPGINSPSAADPQAPAPQPGGHRHGARKMMQMDTDGDGQISRAEMQAAHERRMAMFDRADSNRDGKLSREEMRAMGREYHGGQRGPVRPGAPAAPMPRGDSGYGANG